jgi:hypothetical protein
VDQLTGKLSLIIDPNLPDKILKDIQSRKIANEQTNHLGQDEPMDEENEINVEDEDSVEQRSSLQPKDSLDPLLGRPMSDLEK